jgi:hypothetical protein
MALGWVGCGLITASVVRAVNGHDRDTWWCLLLGPIGLIAGALLGLGLAALYAVTWRGWK